MEVLVDTSVWINYFRSSDKADKLEFFIDENLIVINDLILTELLPLLFLKKQTTLIYLLNRIKKYPLHIDWQEITDYQVLCLKSGTSGVGIPDLLIAQNSIQNNLLVYSNDKHFKFIQDAKIGIELYV